MGDIPALAAERRSTVVRGGGRHTCARVRTHFQILSHDSGKLDVGTVGAAKKQLLRLSEALRRFVPEVHWRQYDADQKRLKDLRRPPSFLEVGSREAIAHGGEYRSRHAKLRDEVDAAAEAIRTAFNQVVIEGKLTVLLQREDPFDTSLQPLPPESWSQLRYTLTGDVVIFPTKERWIAFVKETEASTDPAPQASAGGGADSPTSADSQQGEAGPQSIHLLFDDAQQRVMLPNGKFIDGQCYRVLAALAKHADEDHKNNLKPAQRRTMTSAHLGKELGERRGWDLDPGSVMSAVSECRRRIGALFPIDPHNIIQTPTKGYRLHPCVAFTRGPMIVGK